MEQPGTKEEAGPQLYNNRSSAPQQPQQLRTRRSEAKGAAHFEEEEGRWSRKSNRPHTSKDFGAKKARTHYEEEGASSSNVEAMSEEQKEQNRFNVEEGVV